MIDSQSLRQALGQFATGVTVVTTRCAQGEAVGVTASSFNSVSLDPPLVLWSIGKSAYSYQTFAEAEHFAVHVLSAEQQALSNRFGRAGADKFADLKVTQGIANLPLLADCLVRFECQVEHRYEGGDHLILVGRVLRLEKGATPKPPLLFHGGRYGALAQAS